MGPTPIPEDLPEVRSVYGPITEAERELEEPGQVAPSVPTAVLDRYPDIQATIDAVRELGPKAQQGDAAATAELTALAETELARPDGGRPPVTKRLAAYGFTGGPDDHP